MRAGGQRPNESGASTVRVLAAVVVVAVVAAVALVLVGRSGSKSQSTSAAGPAAGVVRGGTMVIATGSTSGVLNPATTSNGGIHPNAEPMFNGLLAFGPSGDVVPDLAASLPVVTNNADGTQDVVFTLRKGMVWQNNTPITNDDVVFSFTESLLRYQSRTAASMAPALGVKGAGNRAVTPPGAITEPDGAGGLQVKFHFRYPYGPLLKQMNVTEAPIIPKNVYAHCAVDGGDGTLGNQTAPFCPENLHPVGSGPFMWASTTPTQITLDRNPHYFKAGLPYLDHVVFLVSSSPQIGLQAARGQAGSIDVGSVSANNLGLFTAKADYSVVQVPRGSGGGNCITTLAFNLWRKGESAAAINAKPADAPYDHPILSNLAVRQAIFEGFDRETALKNIEFGQGRVADSPFHSALKGDYTPQSLPAFDVVKARADLESAGWIDPSGGANPTATRTSDGRTGLPPKGTPLEIDAIHFDTGTQVQYGLQLQANMKQIGVAVTDRPESNGQTQTDMGNRNYDTSFVSFCDGDDPVIGVRRQYVSSQISKTAFTNVSGYRNQSAVAGDTPMDTLWDMAVRASGPAATDVYGHIQRQAAVTLPAVWIVETASPRVSRSVCQGLNNQNTGLFMEAAWCAH